MKHIDSLSQSRQIKLDYQVKFGDYQVQVSKLASQHQAGMAFVARLKRGLQTGKPMDFDGFVSELHKSGME